MFLPASSAGGPPAPAPGDHPHPGGLPVPGPVLLFHNPGPEAAAGAELRHLLEEVSMDVEVEGEPRGEIIDGEPAREDVVDVGPGDEKRVGHLLDRVRPRLTDVVPADADRAVPGGV